MLLLEHNLQLGRKILISGGGRCNFTNLAAPPISFLSENPHFCKSALARYSPKDFIKLVEKHGIAYHEKTLGQLFCDDSSREILAMLEAECKEANVEIRLNCKVESITKENLFHLQTSQGEFDCESLVIATGGLSIPKIGATNFGYKVAEQFGLKVNPPRPALVPLVWSEADRKHFTDLAGVSLPVTAKVGKTAFKENMLFTHRGISGPAILQISSYWNEGDTVEIDLLPKIDTEKFFAEHRNSKMELSTILCYHLPKRFVQTWSPLFALSKPMNQMSDKSLREIGERLHHWRIKPIGTEGFEKAEVTVAGVDTTELSGKTMEAIKVKGLYFIGEVVDVTGWLGGYNFQWAWSSGWAAGQEV